MSEIICDTSPIQHLHQIDMLSTLHTLADHIVVPPAVAEELDTGLRLGVDLPDIQTLEWITVRSPTSMKVLSLVNDMGPGETQVLALALESNDAIVILDASLAREVARSLNVKMMSTLRVLLDAKYAGLIPAVAPLISQLESLRFRFSEEARSAVLKMAGESV